MTLKALIPFLLSIPLVAQIAPYQINPGTNGQTLQTVGGVTAWGTVNYSQLGGTVPTWNQSTTGNAATASNASQLLGSTWASPPLAGYGSTTPEPVNATAVTAQSVSVLDNDPLTAITSYSYNTTNLNNLNVTTDLTNIQPGNLITGLLGAVHVPSTSTAYQVNAVAGFANNSSPSTNVVGVYGQCLAKANNTTCWGVNPVAASDTGLTGVQLIGQEVDVNISNTSDLAVGVSLGGYWRAAPSGGSTGFQVGVAGGSTGAKWNVGFMGAPGCCNNALMVGPATVSSPSSYSQNIMMQHRDAGGVTRNTLIYIDDLGAINLTPYGQKANIAGSINATSAAANVFAGVGSFGFRLTPNTDTPQTEIYGTNAANSLINWYIQNNGLANFTSLSFGVNQILPPTLTGPHGDVSGVKVQLSDGSGTSVPAAFDANGNLTAGAAYFITSLTTTGTSGAATVTSGVLNVPQYTGGSGLTVVQTNGTNNASMTGLNFITSTVNASGLTVTPSNPSTTSEKMEITGTYSGAVAPSQVTGETFPASGLLVGTTDTQTLTNKTVDGVSPTTFNYLDPTSSVQTQLNAKQATLTNPVTGPGSGATVGHLAVMNATSGDVIADGGVVPTSFPGFGTTGSTAAVGNDSRITGAVQSGGALGTPSSGTLTNATGLPVGGLAAQAADTVVMNATGGSAAPTAVAMPTSGTNGCAGSSNALIYNTSTHALGCNTISGGGGGTPSYPVTVTGTVTSGGVPYFSNTTTETSSGILNSNILVKGGGAGGAPTNSSITDNGTTVSTSELINLSASSALSTIGVNFSGTPVTGGSATTTAPLVSIGGGAAGTYSTSGTMLGVNAPTGFGGNLLDLKVNGGASLFTLGASTGLTTSTINTGTIGPLSYNLSLTFACNLGSCQQSGAGPYVYANFGMTGYTGATSVVTQVGVSSKIYLGGGGTTTTGNWTGFGVSTQFGNGSADVYNSSTAPATALKLNPTINVSTSSTSGYTEIYSKPVETAISSTATNYFIQHFPSGGSTANFSVAQDGSEVAKNWTPSTIFSAAGTALPTCAVGIKGMQAVVSDAIVPLYMTAYTSGGGITTAVICSYNGTTYSWLTH